MKRILAVAAGALAAAACSDSTPVGPSSAAQPVAPTRQIATGDVIVTSSNDAGAGSFRAAIALANANPSIQTIAFDPSVNTVDLQSTVLYTGSQNLTIHGNKATINGAGAGGTAFLMNTLGADLTLQELTVRDAAGHGVHVEVDPNATGTVAVSLYDVNLIGNKSHGVLVNDQLDPSTQEGVQPDDRGSSASVAVVVDDGFDIDEYNDGDITGTIVNSSANRNYEEGFDINENNNGDLRVDFAKVTANENGEEGIDLEEDDDFGNSGNLVTVMTDIKTFGNGDGADGALKVREKETGNLDVTLTNVISSHNIGSGIFVRESSGGNAVIHIENALSMANTAGALDPFSLGHGIELLESGGGDMTASVVGATVSANAGFGVTASASGTATAANVQGNANTLGLIGGIVTVAP